MFTEYNYNYQVKEGAMGRACSTDGGIRGMNIEFRWEKSDGKKPLDVGGRIILRWILER
jgi:hypothetical protein